MSRRRLLALPVAVLGLLLAAPSALAVGPSAIGAGTDGTSYVGYPLTGGVQRLAVDGASLAPWGTPGTGPGQLGGIVGISVAAGADGHVWTLDTNRRVQEFTKGGAFVKGTQLPACDAGVAPDATRYGGIDVRVDGASTTPVAVYVAHPCANQVLKLDPASPTLATTETATTTARPGRLSVPRYLTGPANLMNVWVALPTSGAGGTTGSVTGFAPASLAAVAGSTRTYDFVPSDVFGDEYGNVFLADATFNGIREYGSQNEQLNFFGGTGTEAGRVNAPQAFDKLGQDGTELSRNFFVADSGNQRVQRWSAFAGTFWTAAATGTGGGPVVPAAPANSTAPTISGAAVVGQALTCSPGTWTGSPSYAYSWRRGGTQVGTGATYAPVAADAGGSITCVVTATNAGGSASATSAAVTPSAPPAQTPAPENTGRPGIQGTTVVGSTLTGTPGSWTGSPTGYGYQWRRDGAAIAGATGATYALVAADAGRTITVAVTASNAGGSATAVSDGVAVTAAPSTPSTRVGVTINSGAEATNTAAVSLRIREPVGATAVVISNDGSFDTPTQLPVAANDTYSWTLDARGSQKRARVVYVRFVGALLDGNQTFSDDILLDTSAPTVTTATVSAKSSARAATVKVAAKDTGSGVATIQYAKAQTPKGAKTLKPTKARSFRVRPRNAKWVRAVDVAGNKSKWKRVVFKAPKASAKRR